MLRLYKLYYKILFRVAMWAVDIPRCRRICDILIHTIPYNIRFELS
jgi:hypothetical protein